MSNKDDEIRNRKIRNHERQEIADIRRKGKSAAIEWLTNPDVREGKKELEKRQRSQR